MKNEKIKEAFGGIIPDAAADERMRRAVLAFNASKTEKEHNTMFNDKKKRKVLIPVAACFAAAVAAVAALGAGLGWFGRTYTVVLQNGDTLTYRKTDAAANSSLADANVKTRDLAETELTVICPPLESGVGAFHTETGELIGIEGRCGGVKVNMSRQGYAAADAIVDTNAGACVIDGVNVQTGYFMPSKNSKGEVSPVFSAAFTLNGMNVYMESGGYLHPDPNGEALAAILQQLIQNGPPDFLSIRYETK